mmetsp:Transcript_3709/g.8585  ORF Transcript_3709/g.8585 Transcript_3709/m.8585 type:complete len:88 (-) Transcript_3709:439-702(-)
MNPIKRKVGKSIQSIRRDVDMVKNTSPKAPTKNVIFITVEVPNLSIAAPINGDRIIIRQATNCTFSNIEDCFGQGKSSSPPAHCEEK